jgi:hypothetical protein
MSMELDQIYPAFPCPIYVYFHPHAVGVSTALVCGEYTRNADPAPRPVHQLCITLTGRGV